MVLPEPLPIRSNQPNLQFIPSTYSLSPSRHHARSYIPFNSNGRPRVIDLTVGLFAGIVIVLMTNYKYNPPPQDV